MILGREAISLSKIIEMYKMIVTFIENHFHRFLRFCISSGNEKRTLASNSFPSPLHRFFS